MTSVLEIPGESKFWVLKRHLILGKGSFGCATLYEEINTPGSFVVVKDVNMQTMKKEEEMSALELEVAILRRSNNHPNIVQFLDYYHDGEFMVYIVMEYCPFGDLARLEEQMRHRASHPPESFVASVLIQMLAGLHYLHVEQNTLHRDIKPQNIFFCGDDVLRIGDFGVSTILDQCGGVAKAVCGSPYYMAPELYEEKAYDGRADLWSLGVMMYELMTHERPFDAVSIHVLRRQIKCGVFNPIPRDVFYSTQLIELVESLLQTSKTTRPTVRRVLRGQYVQSHLDTLPLMCLKSEHYTSLFGEEMVKKAIKNKRTDLTLVTKAVDINSSCHSLISASKNNGDTNSMGGEKSIGTPKLVDKKVSELEMWLEANGGCADAFIDDKLTKCSHGYLGNQPNQQSISLASASQASCLVSQGTTNIMQHQSPPSKGTHNLLGNEDENVGEIYEDDFESEGSD